MAWARVQGNSALDDAAATTMAVTISAVGSGNLVNGCVTFDGGGPTLTSVTDNQGNTYNRETTVIDTTNGQAFAAFSRTNITNGPVTITANFSSGVSFKKILVEEFSGGSTASTDERDSSAHGGQFQNAAGTGTDAITSGTFTTTQNGDLLWGCALGALAAGFSAPALASNGTSFSTGTQDATNSSNFLQSEFRTQATAGSGTAATFTQAANDPRVTFLIAIKAPASGAVSANPTGVEATASAGTPTVSAKATTNVTGVAGTAQVGTPTVTAAANAPVTGPAATAQVNTPTVSGKAVVPITGAQGTGQVGTLTVTTGGAVSVAVSGVEATAAAGTPTISGKAIVALTGVEAAGAAGTPTVTAAAVATVTGVAATPAAGTPTISGKAVTTITGVPANASAGDLAVTVPSVTVILVGVEAVGQVGDLVGIVPSAGGYWDTSDPLFYEWWRKAKKREEARKITPVIEEPAIERPVAAKVKGKLRPPSSRVAAALSTVETLADLKELKPLDSAYVGRLINEYEQLRQQADDDEVEALLILALS